MDEPVADPLVGDGLCDECGDPIGDEPSLPSPARPGHRIHKDPCAEWADLPRT